MQERRNPEFMKEDNEDIENMLDDEGNEAHSSYIVPKENSSHLSGMFQNWFLDYASYVILERAVPHIQDGLKPVQRRILHAMKELDDGRFNKVANIVGYTMQYHPHGDASIGDALVQIGQKELLVETQGNWGNILTGDSAAAPRYIEARLSEFALETVFNPKTTDWTVSYDGRKPEPLTLPVKFPLLLAQGAEGIAVGLSSKILPHNFNEILDAAIAYLRGEEFTLYPDFPTGGFIDVSKYNDGERGGSVRVRAKIEKIDNKTLEITDIPYGRTTGAVIESIVKAQEKGKIKVRKVDDNTAEHADIIVHLLPGTSSDRAIDALYAFTDCEVSISPNCCVISDRKPHFLTVSDVLRHSVDTTKELLRTELAIQRGELTESLLYASLEKIFIEERIYKDKEYEQSANLDEAIVHIDKRLEPFKPGFVREITRDDIMKLFDIKMGRILKFNSDKANAYIESLKDRIVGRVLAEDIIDPATGEKIASLNETVTPKLADAICKVREKVTIRSVLTCKSQLGVCIKCYGQDLATAKEVEVGEAVGIIAAQSIGEPGTQLTMRTFHSGGVASDEDITQGLPRVEELFEARKPKHHAIIAEIAGTVLVSEENEMRVVTITPDEGESREYLIPYGSRLTIKSGDKIKPGDKITEGSVNPHDILRICGLGETQRYLVYEVQKVYKSQGVGINDKHIEVMVRQMLHKVKIEDSGDTDFLPGEYIDINSFESANAKAIENGGLPAVARPILLGITKASLATDSFLSAASFQETTRVLTDAAIKGKVDPLIGLKENVIIGKLIPAGTGMSRYRNIKVVDLDEVDEKDEEKATAEAK